MLDRHGIVYVLGKVYAARARIGVGGTTISAQNALPPWPHGTIYENCGVHFNGTTGDAK